MALLSDQGIIAEYTNRIGEIITGMVQRMDGKNVIVDIGRGQGTMPPEEQVKNEYYRLNSRISVLPDVTLQRILWSVGRPVQL